MSSGTRAMPKRTKQSVFPQAQSSFLNEVIASFRKRAKAIGHAGADITVQRVIERDDGEDIEKIEIQLKSSLGPQASVFLWSDRWIFVHAGHLTKQGWLWEWTKEGRLMGPDKERELGQISEKMLEASLCAAKPPEFCEALWKRAIATGPAMVGSAQNSAPPQKR